MWVTMIHSHIVARSPDYAIIMRKFETALFPFHYRLRGGEEFGKIGTQISPGRVIWGADYEYGARF